MSDDDLIRRGDVLGIARAHDCMNGINCCGEVVGEDVRALPADPRAEAMRDLAEAAKGRMRYRCNDTCSKGLTAGEYPCSCGHDALVAALARWREVTK